MQDAIENRMPDSPIRVNDSPYQAVRCALREVRRSKGQTQQAATTELACSKDEYGNWEYAKNLPSFMLTVSIMEREIGAIADRLDVVLDLTLIGRMMREACGADPERWRYFLGRMASMPESLLEKEVVPA